MIPFAKYHGTGNDFVIVEGDSVAVPAERRALAVALCDRTRGIAPDRIETDRLAADTSRAGDRSDRDGRVGADGVLFLELEDGSPPSVEMALVQPDGSTAAMCGNGARCAAAWGARRLGRPRGRETTALPSGARGVRRETDERSLVLDTPAGPRRADVGAGTVTVEMGSPTFDPERVPLARSEPLLDDPFEGLRVTAVNTGVPHAVAFVEDLDRVELDVLAPPIRHAGVFPEGTNVTLAAPREPDGNDGPDAAGDDRTDRTDAGLPAFDQRTYERGVEGETAACGTGAVAIAAVARACGRVDPDADSVAVYPLGGRLEVGFVGDETFLSGPVAREYGGRLDPDAWIGAGAEAR